MRMPDARKPWIVGASVFVVVGALLVVRTVTAPGFDLPPRWYDAQDYENLGYHLAIGKGFGVGWDDPTWQAPYRDARIARGYSWLDYHEGWRRRDLAFAPTTVRPPALPLLIALSYRVAGRSFGAIRLIDALFLALTLAIASGLATHWSGSKSAGALTALAGWLAPHYDAFARLSLTEPMSALVVIAAVAFLCAFTSTGLLRHAALAGLLLGCAILTRSALLASVPIVAATLYGLTRWWNVARRPAKPMAATAVFLVGALLVPAPWWARNCATLETFMPLGAQGGIGLAGAYGDVPYARTLEGLPWTHPNRWDFFEPVTREAAYQALPPELQERELAKFGQASALAWTRANIEKLPVLALRRLATHWTVREPLDVALRLLAALGFLTLVRRREAWIALSFVAANSVTVMATYASDAGRFLAPIEAILFLFAGTGLAAGARKAIRLVPWRIAPRRARDQSP